MKGANYTPFNDPVNSQKRKNLIFFSNPGKTDNNNIKSSCNDAKFCLIILRHRLHSPAVELWRPLIHAFHVCLMQMLLIMPVSLAGTDMNGRCIQRFEISIDAIRNISANQPCKSSLQYQVHAQPSQGFNQSIPAATCEKSGRLASMGQSIACPGCTFRQANPPVYRIFRLPLVPCHGTRMFPESGDRRNHERPFRLYQGRP